MPTVPLVWYFLIKLFNLKGPMAAPSNKNTILPPKEAVVNTGKPPYPFRTAVALLLLAGNFLVAAIYFRTFNP